MRNKALGRAFIEIIDQKVTFIFFLERIDRWDLNLISLDREKIDLFKSDFRILADYLYQMRVNKDYIADKTDIAHVDELLTLMSEMTGDNRFEETINDL